MDERGSVPAVLCAKYLQACVICQQTRTLCLNHGTNVPCPVLALQIYWMGGNTDPSFPSKGNSSTRMVHTSISSKDLAQMQQLRSWGGLLGPTVLYIP